MPKNILFEHFQEVTKYDMPLLVGFEILGGGSQFGTARHFFFLSIEGLEPSRTP